MASIEIHETDDPFMSPNKSYTMPQIDQIMQTEKKPKAKKIAPKPKTFEEIVNVNSEQEEMEEFRLEIKQKLLQKLE